MHLIRVKGKEGGIRIYSANYFSVEQAETDYWNDTGYEPDELTKEFKFDSISCIELQNWIMTGDADPF